MTLVERYSFGDGDHLALSLLPCTVHLQQALLAGYAERGFPLVFWRRPPDPKNDWKGPRESGWQIRTYALSDYREGMQVGVKLGTQITPGRFLVDMDLDWEPGIRFARQFLPVTGFAFGRQSKPIGHALYTTSAPVAYLKFEDIDGTTFVERRGTRTDGSIGLQTVLPPSVHRKTGEVVTLKADGAITHDDTVVTGVTLYAVACLLGRHWPKNGPDTNQHDTAAYAAGFLCQRGVDPDVIPDIVRVAATLGGDDNVHDRVVYAQDTVARFRQRKKRLAGGPKLAQEIGEPVVTRLRQWLPLADEEAAAIDRLNQRFAIIAVGNKVVVMETAPDGGIKKLWPFEEFRRLLVKDRIKIETDGDEVKLVPLANIWLAHKDGRRYEQLVYAMPGSAEHCGPDDYNGWLGFTVQPAPGDWSKNKDHLLRIVCAGDKAHYDWLYNWMAALVQKPGRHALTAVVLRGKQGTGKGHYANRMLGALFHPQQYLHITGAEALTGRFNEHLSGKVLVFADESTWGGDPAAADRLKGLVTESTVPIERKFLPLVEEPSALHIVIASNNDWPIAIPMDDRRFIVLDVAEQERQNDAHFAPLHAELAAGGWAAMLNDLLQHRVDEYALRHPPSSKGKREIMVRSLTTIQRWWYEILVRGWLSDSEQDWPTSAPKGEFHLNYTEFLDALRDTRTRRSTETELGIFMRKNTPVREQRTLKGTKVEYSWNLPSLEDCRAFWVTACGWPEDFEWGQEDDEV